MASGLELSNLWRLLATPGSLPEPELPEPPGTGLSDEVLILFQKFETSQMHLLACIQLNAHTYRWLVPRHHAYDQLTGCSSAIWISNSQTSWTAVARPTSSFGESAEAAPSVRESSVEAEELEKFGIFDNRHRNWSRLGT